MNASDIDTEFNLEKYISIPGTDADICKLTEQIDYHIAKLIESELSGYSSQRILLIGRKSRSLYDPHLMRLIANNKRFQLGLCTLFSHTQASFVVTHTEKINRKCQRKIKKHNFHSKRICIITDAINTGNEIERVINSLKKPQKSIEKVCGYLAMSSTITSLKTKYPKIQFSFVKLVDDVDEYYAEQNNLHLIYQGRPVPLEDNDHPYCRFSLKYQIRTDDAKNVITEILKPYLIEEISQETCKFPGVEMYSANLDSSELLQKFPHYIHDSYEFERISIKIKIISAESKIIVTAVSPVYLKQKLLYGNCDFHLLTPFCEIPKQPESNAVPTEIICPYCIDQHFSQELLEYVKDNLIRQLNERNIEIDADTIRYLF